MDREELWRVLKALENCGVDTAQEQELIRARTEMPIMLVAGTQAARPLDLLTGLGLEPPEGFTPSFPVQCGYGENLHIQALDRAGERHHFSNWADFCAFLEKDLAQVRECTLSAPASLLSRTQLRFLILDAGIEEKLARSASECTGFLVVLPCAAGAPGDSVEKLCRWVRDVRALPGQVGVVLHHTETGMTNAMLPMVLSHWLGVDVPSWRCGYPPMGKSLSPETLLELAAQRLVETRTAGADEEMLAGCRKRAADKTLARERELEAEAEEKRSAAAWLLKSGGEFRASAENAGAVLRCSLTDQQEKFIREDIAGLAALLREQLPGMTQELVEQRGADAKEDLKNLGGDYIEEVFNRYLSAMVEHIGQELWQPKIKQVFQQAVEEYRALVRSAPASLLKADPEGMSRTLKAIDVNLGAYQDPFAAGLGSAVSKVLYLGINALLIYSQVSPLSRAVMSKDIRQFSRTAGQAVTAVAEQMISPKTYGEKLMKLLQKTVSEMPAQIYDILKSSIIPMINADIAQQYQAMVDQSCGVLEEQANVQSREETRLLEQRDVLKAHRYQLLGRDGE